MKTPRPGPITAVIVLMVLCAVFAALPQSAATVPVEAVLLALVASEIDRSGRLLALALVSLGARLLPRQCRENLKAEWRDHVLSAGEAGTRPLFVAIGILCWGAPRLAVRYGLRPRRRAARFVGNLFAAYLEREDVVFYVPMKARLEAGEPITKTEEWRMALTSLTTLTATTFLYPIAGRRRVGRIPTPVMAMAGTLVLLAAPAAQILFVHGAIGLVYDAAWYFAFTAIFRLTMKVTGPTDYAVQIIERLAGPKLD